MNAIDAFVAARAATDRKTFGRTAKAMGLNLANREHRDLVRSALDTGTPLMDAAVRVVALDALVTAIGPAVTTVAWTVWPRINHTRYGQRHEGTWSAFAAWHSAQASIVAVKGEGAVHNATTTVDGHRCNASTAFVHAVNLDCDGLGEWDALVAGLRRLGLAFVAHQSGGWKPGVPKWHIIIPLAEPFLGGSPEREIAWRESYTTLRTALGAVAGLRGVGFDPATDAISNPAYTGNRRSTEAPPRVVLAQAGVTLDLDKLLAALPAPVVMSPNPPVPQVPRRPHTTTTEPQPRASATSPRSVEEHCVAPPRFRLEEVFAARGWLGRVLPDGKRAVRCPFNDAHSTPLPAGAEPTTATILYPPSDASHEGALYCSHKCGWHSGASLLESLSAAGVNSPARVAAKPTVALPGLPGLPRTPSLPGRMPR